MNSFYDENAADFFARTAHLNVERLYAPFLAHVPSGGKILDAGCGSGRDTKAFLALGYAVTAFDASAETVRLARDYSGADVRQMRFEEMTFEAEFDGVWTCASLLHVPERELPNVLALCVRALKPGGVWYLSFKYGEGEVTRQGRHFTNMSEGTLRALLARFGELEVLTMFVTGDARAERGDEQWVNAVVRKRGEGTMKVIDSDAEFDEVQRGGSGFVFHWMCKTAFRKDDDDLLHVAGCPWIKRPGGFVWMVFFEHEEETLAWLQQRCGAEGVRWRWCRECGPEAIRFAEEEMS